MCIRLHLFAQMRKRHRLILALTKRRLYLLPAKIRGDVRIMGKEIDWLTKFPNRYSFARKMKRILKEEAGKKAGYVILVDIDDFRMINQGFGYDVGDAFIRDFAQYLRSKFAATHEIFRMNNDVFLLLCTSPAQFEQLDEDINEIMGRCQYPWIISGRTMYCTVSLSAVYYPADGRTVEEICRNLDSALYKAKESGKSNFIIYREEIENIANIVIKHREIEKMLRDAVNKNFRGFQLHYQALYDHNSNNIIGAEALLRYATKEGLLIYPGSFIPLAEQTGLIIPIGKYILKTAAHFCRKVINAGYADFCVNVNVSICQLQKPDFTETVLAILEEANLPHENMVLEITESVAAYNMECISHACQLLQSKGIQIALDDFGTGYSSLNMIRTMPVNLIKIDRSFVNDVTLDAYTYMFVKVITELGHMLGVKVCAEGIEQTEQLLCCKEIGIDFMQGYLYHQAAPEQEFLRMIGKTNDTNSNY